MQVAPPSLGLRELLERRHGAGSYGMTRRFPRGNRRPSRIRPPSRSGQYYHLEVLIPAGGIDPGCRARTASGRSCSGRTPDRRAGCLRSLRWRRWPRRSRGRGPPPALRTRAGFRPRRVTSPGIRHPRPRIAPARRSHEPGWTSGIHGKPAPYLTTGILVIGASVALRGLRSGAPPRERR